MPLLQPPGTAIKTVPFACDLAKFGERTALVTPTGQLSYVELADQVDAMAERLGRERRLVLLTGGNTIEAIVAYLACLAGGHPLLLAPSADPAAAYDPDVIIGDGTFHERRPITAHDLHPELALLLSTSGSTGSAKLVRLSHENLQANAESIADSLGIRPDDRAATTLPMHYCYGLSVINSHLSRGAGLIVTGLSVSDVRYWDLFRTHRGTTFAGVPYTFDLLERAGFERMRLPDLRYITQAGGRLAPERVRSFAALGARSGWDLVVMYGQTEATARMAYLPPSLAASHPQCVGIPIPGGSLRLSDTSELIYSGPNVMLGYANTATDLALGRTVTELSTGDIARLHDNGLCEIVGRRDRFIKSFGLRIDLGQVEARLRREAITVYCAASAGEDLVVAVEQGTDPDRIRRLAATASGLPRHAVRVSCPPVMPRLPNGKPDYAAISASSVPAPSGQEDVRSIYSEVLGVDASDDDTFVGLGGDSLSYVALSIRLEDVLGHLPDRWHTTPIRDLRHRAKRRTRRLETSIALRALSILLVVGTHAGLFAIAGGAHLLLGVAGFNFGRFQVTATPRLDRVRGMVRSTGRIALASMAWIAFAFLISDAYTPAQMFLMHNFARPGVHNDFWFIEALVYMLAGMLALLSILDSAERRYPFGLPMALMSLALIARYHPFSDGSLPTPLAAVWLFTLGWAAAKATRVRHRALVTLAVLATVPGFFGDLPREAVIIAGFMFLIWVPALPSLAAINRVAGPLAAASLYIYLTHWQVFPHLTKLSPLLAVLASLVAGILYAQVASRITAPVRHLLRQRQTSTGT